jgi:hypothetical protein
LQTTVPESGLVLVSAALSVGFYEGSEARLDSNFLQNFSNRQLCNPAHGAIGTEGPVASTDEAVFGRFWVADARDAAFSDSTAIRAAPSGITDDAVTSWSGGRGKSAACDEEGAAP